MFFNISCETWKAWIPGYFNDAENKSIANQDAVTTKLSQKWGHLYTSDMAPKVSIIESERQGTYLRIGIIRVSYSSHSIGPDNKLFNVITDSAHFI